MIEFFSLEFFFIFAIYFLLVLFQHRLLCKSYHNFLKHEYPELLNEDEAMMKNMENNIGWLYASVPILFVLIYFLLIVPPKYWTIKE